MKKLIAILLAITLLIILAGCGLQLSQSESGGDAIQSSQEIVAPTTTGSAESPDTATSETSGSDVPLVRAIMFDSTMETPVEYGVFKEAVSFTLYETSPGVFSGGGYTDGQYSSQEEGTTLWGDMYETSRYSFQGMEHGKTVGCPTLMYSEYHRWKQFMTEEPDVGVSYWCHRYTREYTPLWDFTLYIDGDTARLVIHEEDDYTYEGTVTELPLPETQDIKLLDGYCISVNSVLTENNVHNPKDPSRILDYRAMLTAKQTNGYDYSGDLCVYGTGDGMPFVDEAVRFTMQLFDAGAYRDAGGKLTYSFEAFGVINTSAGKYIVLADKAGVVLEPVDSDCVFGGHLLPEDRFDEERYIAEETKPLMYTLYDGSKNVVPSDWSDIHEGVAPFYPAWLFPRPMVGRVYEMYGEEQWMWNGLAAIDTLRTYYAEYAVSLGVGESFKDLYESMVRQYSGSDNLKTELYIDENGISAGIITFTKGAYYIEIRLGNYGFLKDVMIAMR